jgi:hypothetical protein
MIYFAAKFNLIPRVFVFVVLLDIPHTAAGVESLPAQLRGARILI